MPFEFNVDYEKLLIYKRVWGEYDDAQSNAAIEEFRTIANHDHCCELHDLRDVSRYEVSMDWIRQVAESTTRAREQKSVPPKKVAYVAPSPAAYGTGRALGVLQSDSSEELRVFDSMEDACEWLGVDLATLPSS